jgi:flagellar hook-associated protein 3 FlgL
MERASDDPAAASRAMVLRSQQRSIETRHRVGEDATARLGATDVKLGEAMDSFHRILELTVAGANGTMSAATRTATATVLRTLRDGLVGIANARYMGEPLFAGYSDADAVAWDAGTSTWQFTGSSGEAITRQVSDTDVVRVNLTAGEVFRTGGLDVFTALDELAAAVETNDVAGMRTGIDRLTAARATLTGAQATIGAMTNRVESLMRRGESMGIALQTELSEVEDVDLAVAITDQSRLQASYQAALGATAKSIQSSLVDWLR